MIPLKLNREQKIALSCAVAQHKELAPLFRFDLPTQDDGTPFAQKVRFVQIMIKRGEAKSISHGVEMWWDRTQVYLFS